METYFKTLSEMISINRLNHVHLIIKRFIFKRPSHHSTSRGCSHFSKDWKILTKHQNILSIVEGYKIPFLSIPHQVEIPGPSHMTKTQTQTIENKIIELLRKRAIRKVKNTSREFLSNMFSLKKKDGGNRPVISLKCLNNFIPYQHFKMEVLYCLKYILDGNEFLYKTNLKAAYFLVPLSKQSIKVVRFVWPGSLFEFLCLYFGLQSLTYISF